MNEPLTATFKPPYMAFSTLWGFFSELSQKELPPRIDRSLMASKSGTDQANLLAAFSAFELVGPEQRVQPRLVELTSPDLDERKRALRELLAERYPTQVKISEDNGTGAQLQESFKEDFALEGDTRRKAMAFFLHAARTAGLHVSPHFPATRGGSGAPGVPRKRGSNGIRKKLPITADKPVAVSPQAAGGDTYTVTLQSGGQVSVVVDVNLFGLSTTDRDFVIDLVDRLKGYPQAEANEPSPEGAMP